MVEKNLMNGAVPYEQIDQIRREIGLKETPFARELGVSLNGLMNWKERGTAPRKISLAAKGLLFEKAAKPLERAIRMVHGEFEE